MTCAVCTPKVTLEKAYHLDSLQQIQLREYPTTVLVYLHYEDKSVLSRQTFGAKGDCCIQKNKCCIITSIRPHVNDSSVLKVHPSHKFVVASSQLDPIGVDFIVKYSPPPPEDSSLYLAPNFFIHYLMTFINYSKNE